MADNPFDAIETPTDNTNKKENNTVSNNEGKIVTTLKAGSGYDAPWAVLHTDTHDEALEIMSSETFKDYLKAAAETASAFAGMMPQKTSGRGGAVSAQGKPQGATQPSNGATPPEGYVFRSGMGKNNRPWQAFMPIDRNSGLEPIWLDKDGNPKQ